MSLFEESVRKSWGAPSAAKPQGDAAKGKKEKKDKKDGKDAGGKNAKQAAKDARLAARQAQAAAKDEFKKDPNDPSAH